AACHDGVVRIATLGLRAQSGHQCLVPNADRWQQGADTTDVRSDSTGVYLWHADPAGLVRVGLAGGAASLYFVGCCPGEIRDWCISPDELTAAVKPIGEDTHYVLLRRERDSASGRVIAEFDSEAGPAFDSKSERVAGLANGRLWVRE